jgi:hypothetical protein
VTRIGTKRCVWCGVVCVCVVAVAVHDASGQMKVD